MNIFCMALFENALPIKKALSAGLVVLMTTQTGALSFSKSNFHAGGEKEALPRFVSWRRPAPGPSKLVGHFPCVVVGVQKIRLIALDHGTEHLLQCP